MAKKTKEKFEFGLDFQETILQYTVTDKYGYKALAFYQDSYFALLTHQFIAFALKRYFKAKKRLPGKIVLKENLRQLYNHKDFVKHLSPELKSDIDTLVDKLYTSLPKDSEDILAECVKFAQYVELKHELETADITDFSNYSTIHKKIQKAISIGSNLTTKKGLKLVGDVEQRIANRHSQIEYFSSPYWQLNRSQNSGGIKKGAMIMFMSEAKRFKTGTMINFCLGCLSRRKKGLYIDLENGQDELATRSDQSLLKSTQKEIQRGEMDQRLLKQIRKYKRLGAELVILRMPARTTTCDDIQKVIDDFKMEDGLVFDFGVIDFGDLLGSISGKEDDTERISDAFLDMKNLALYNDWDFILTASHVQRPALKRRGTRYLANDVAKCIDKIRYLDICIGLQEDESEMEQGVMRWEIVDQRDGPPQFTMWFWVDIERQTLKEFTKEQIKKLRDEEGDMEERRKSTKDI